MREGGHIEQNDNHITPSHRLKRNIIIYFSELRRHFFSNLRRKLAPQKLPLNRSINLMSIVATIKEPFFDTPTDV